MAPGLLESRPGWAGGRGAVFLPLGANLLGACYTAVLAGKHYLYPWLIEAIFDRNLCRLSTHGVFGQSKFPKYPLIRAATLFLSCHIWYS